jgi:hypothetical protein
MVGKDGGKAKPLKQAKKGPKELDEVRVLCSTTSAFHARSRAACCCSSLSSQDDMAFQEKKRQEAKELAALKAKAGEKGAFGGKGLSYSGKK